MSYSTPVNPKSASRLPIIEDYRHDPFTLRVAVPDDDRRIDSLRQAAYASASYFSIPDPDAVTRRTDPDDAVCLVVANKSHIAATLRLVRADTQARAEKLLQGPTPLSNKYFPTVTLCRGATDKHFRRQGLMVFLVGIGVAVANTAGLGSATGMQAKATPHHAAMLRNGWQNMDVATHDVECIQIDDAQMNLVYIARDQFVYSQKQDQLKFSELNASLNAAAAVKEAASLMTNH